VLYWLCLVVHAFVSYLLTTQLLFSDDTQSKKLFLDSMKTDIKKIFDEEAKSLKSQSNSTMKSFMSTLPVPKKYEDAASALTAAVELGEKFVGRLEKATAAADSVLTRLLAERAEYRAQEDLRNQAELQQYRMGQQNRHQQRFRDGSPQRDEYRRDPVSRFDSSPRDQRADKRERERVRDPPQERVQDAYYGDRSSRTTHEDSYYSTRTSRDDDGVYQDREPDEDWNSGVEGGAGGGAPASPPVLGGRGGRGGRGDGRGGGRGSGRGRIGIVRDDGAHASKRSARGGGLYSS
jgi:hypothetical protein